ncbi:MAG: hypothetical protein SGJ02_05295 [bacterium]|nr:hypothetical protein [bacterium]
MLQIRVNGQSSPYKAGSLPKITDVIELIKGSIDPAHIITGLRINGRDLTEGEWQSSPTQFCETDILEVDTGTTEQFLSERLAVTPNLLENIYILFRSCRQSFQAGSMEEGNRIMVTGVNDLKAFFEWYCMLLRMVPAESKGKYDIKPQLDELTTICRDICQQQLYQSWWALATTIQERLEPALDKLESHFRRNVCTQ